MPKLRKIEISIPNPCSQNWEQMTPDGKGRHCGQCSKTVMDFSNYTDKELLDFISKAKEKICGRFYNNQLNRLIIANEPADTPFFRRLFYGTAIAAGVSGCMNNQNNVQNKKGEIQLPVDTNKKTSGQSAKVIDTSHNHKQKAKLVDSIVVTDNLPPPPPLENEITGIIEVCKQQPKFPDNLNKYLSENINYPKEAMDKNIEGTVYASFIIEKDGTVSTIKILRGIQNAPMLDSAGFHFGIVDNTLIGKNKRVQYTVPVKFKLN